MTGPTYSSGVRIDALMYGSVTLAILNGSGQWPGLSTSIVLPSFKVTLYLTVGAETTRPMSNSRCKRSWITSRCSRPRNPQRNPKPRAAELSFS